MLAALTQGQIIAESRRTRAQLDRQLFDQWHKDFSSESDIEREVIVLELRARLLRLAPSVNRSEVRPTNLLDGTGKQQHTHLEKAELMACFVARHYTSRIQIKDIAECVSLHPDYAATLFRKTFGTTLNALITRHRIAHAQRQLVTTDERVLNIAHDSGFDSLSRFNRAFKQLAGITPRQYRKTLGRPAASVTV
jgi:AraC-like DNA-binding protein